MSLPEKKQKHYKVCSQPTDPCLEHFACDTCKYGICAALCPACAVAARDKEWAEWFVERFEKIAKGQAVTTVFSKADFEALKKLAEE